MYFQFLYQTETMFEEYYKKHPELTFPEEDKKDWFDWDEYIAEADNIDEAIQDFVNYGSSDLVDVDHEVEIVADKDGTKTKEREMIDVRNKDFYRY